MTSAIIDIQCILGPKSKYFIKEMSVADVCSLASQHWIFKHAPSTHNSKSRAVNLWLFRHYHQLSLDCGDVEYTEIERILKSLHFECIYVKGEEKRQIIQDFIPEANVIDMGADLNCPRIDQLHSSGNIRHGNYEMPCCIYHTHLDRSQCTYNRVYALLKWLKNNI